MKKYKAYYQCRLCGLKFNQLVDVSNYESETELERIMLNQAPTYYHHKCFPNRIGVADLDGLGFEESPEQ